MRSKVWVGKKWSPFCGIRPAVNRKRIPSKLTPFGEYTWFILLATIFYGLAFRWVKRGRMVDGDWTWNLFLVRSYRQFSFGHAQGFFNLRNCTEESSRLGLSLVHSGSDRIVIGPGLFCDIEYFDRAAYEGLFIGF